MTGWRLPRSVDGGPRDGGYGARWPGYLGPNRLIEKAWEQQREVRRLTGWWFVDVDVRKGRSAVGSSAWRRKTSRGSMQRRVHREEARVALRRRDDAPGAVEGVDARLGEDVGLAGVSENGFVA